MKRLFSFRRSPLRPLAPAAVYPDQVPACCTRCGANLDDQPAFVAHRVCGACGTHYPIGARDRVAGLVGESFRETDANLTSTDPLGFADDEPYASRLIEQRRRTGQADALLTGTGTIDGHRVVLAVLDFGFMGGSMGVVVGEKIARAADRARHDRLPLVTVVASGGARMQEGMLSLLQMAKTAAAIQRLHAAGVPHVSILTHPTTGGVFASFASLGDVIIAEPRALIGFAGPRVVEQFLGRPLPPGSHTAEFLFEHGLIDGIVPRPDHRAYVAAVLDVLVPPKGSRKAPPLRWDEPVDVPGQERVWDTVTAARDPARPTAMDYIARMVEGFVELRGDRESGEDPAIVAGLGFIDGRRVALLGIERGHGEEAQRRRQGRPVPEGYRKAQRLMRLAARFRLPIVSLVDTPGAYPGLESEERGLAGEIAESMALMSDLPTPIVAAIVGEGGSGGALALAVADRVLMQAGAIYSVIAPEGAAAILYRDASRAPELAEKLKLTAADLRRLGIVDCIVAEPAGGAAADPDAAASLLQAAIGAALAEIGDRAPAKLVQERFARYRAIGRDFARETRLPKAATGGRARRPRAARLAGGAPARGRESGSVGPGVPAERQPATENGAETRGDGAAIAEPTRAKGAI